MSHISPRKPPVARSPFTGLPTGSAVAIISAALVTGALLSIYFGQIDWPFLALFAIAGIVTATIVDPRGLFVTVAIAPILFLIAAAATGWSLARSDSFGESLSRTEILVIFYPLVQFFPVLLATTVGSTLIAIIRLKLLQRHNAAIERREQAQRKRAARSNRRVATEGRRARERTYSVHELSEKMREHDRSTRR